MSAFLNIKNREERDKMIDDYLALKERIKKRNMEERMGLMDHRRDLEENFEPVVASNAKMAKEIVDELIPIANELREVNNNKTKLFTTPQIGIKRDINSQPKRRLKDNHFGPNAEAFLSAYLNPDTRNKQVDTTFGIRYENGPWMIGNKQIKFEGDDIKIDGEIYEGTDGLWSLITSKTPKNYTQTDLERYKELLHETSAMHQHYDSKSSYPRASGGKKWTRILRPIWQEFESIGSIPQQSRSDKGDDADSLDGTPVINDDGDDDNENVTSKSYLDADNSDDEYFHSASEGGDGIKMYLQKHGRCFGLQKCDGNGMKLTPRPTLPGIRGNGLYVRVGSGIYEGHGLILGPQSPFKNIPLLGWIL